MSMPGDRISRRGHDEATGVLTSRTVKVMVCFDEHSARCVARSRAPGAPGARAGSSAGPGLGRGYAAPAAHQAARGVLHGERVAEVVAPRPVDVQAPAAQALLAEP